MGKQYMQAGKQADKASKRKWYSYFLKNNFMSINVENDIISWRPDGGRID